MGVNTGFRKFSLLSSLGSPTSSQRLKEARHWQDNHHLIRDYIESRLAVKQYKLEKLVWTHRHSHVHIV